MQFEKLPWTASTSNSRERSQWASLEIWVDLPHPSMPSTALSAGRDCGSGAIGHNLLAIIAEAMNCARKSRTTWTRLLVARATAAGGAGLHDCGDLAASRTTGKTLPQHFCVWQGRYYCCPLDLPHLWAASRRRVESRPGGLGYDATGRVSAVKRAIHCESGGQDGLVDLTRWRAGWTPSAWRE